MTHSRPVVAVVAVSLVVAASLHGRQAAPWFGTWVLNPARSDQRAEPSPYKKVTTRIEPAGEGMKVVYDMVGTRGGVSHREWLGAFDGRDYPVNGLDYVLTNAYRQLDDRRYEIVIKVDGRQVATAVATVSADGHALTVETTEKDGRGVAVTSRAVYERQ